MLIKAEIITQTRTSQVIRENNGLRSQICSTVTNPIYKNSTVNINEEIQCTLSLTRHRRFFLTQAYFTKMGEI